MSFLVSAVSGIRKVRIRCVKVRSFLNNTKVEKNSVVKLLVIPLIRPPASTDNVIKENAHETEFDMGDMITIG